MPKAAFDSTSQRLVTQNLLVSAASYDFQGKMSWPAIQDLSVFIDAFCLYDEIVVLGRQAYSMLPNRSDLIAAVGDVVRVDEPHADARVVSAACGHLGAFLNERVDSDRYRPLIDSLSNAYSVYHAFATTPDGPDELQQGEEWLRTVPSEIDVLAALDQDEDFHRSITFLVRTFLYLAYADINQITLTPDSTRAKVLDPIARSERKLRQLLLEKIKDEFQKNSFADDVNIKRRITPLASIVFDRASKPQNIAREMVKLRYDLAPMRERLAKVESRLASGSRKDELAVAREWSRVFEEIEKVYGRGEGLLSLESTLAFAELAGKFAEKPSSPETWAKMLALPVNVIRRMVSRLPAIEIHRMQFPSSERLQRVVHKLFGDIDEVLAAN